MYGNVMKWRVLTFNLFFWQFTKNKFQFFWIYIDIFLIIIHSYILRTYWSSCFLLWDIDILIKKYMHTWKKGFIVVLISSKIAENYSNFSACLIKIIVLKKCVRKFNQAFISNSEILIIICNFKAQIIKLYTLNALG